MTESKFEDTIAAKWIKSPCRVCGKIYGDHTLTDMKRCYLFRELVKNDVGR